MFLLSQKLWKKGKEHINCSGRILRNFYYVVNDATLACHLVHMIIFHLLKHMYNLKTSGLNYVYHLAYLDILLVVTLLSRKSITIILMIP